MKALVTGAGSGIGRAISEELATKGCDVLLIGKVLSELESLERELSERFPTQSFASLQIDLARTTSADELYGWCEECGHQVDVLVNNAGVFAFCDLLNMTQERIESLLLLHVVTLTKCCRLFGADMASRGEGYILNLASYSRWMPFPGLSLYAASKAYVNNFSVAFSREMEAQGVRVTAVSPAGVATNLYGLSSKLQSLGLKLGVLISPKSCAKRSLKAMWRGRRSIVPDWWNRLFIPICKYMPGFIIRPLRRYTMKYQE